MRKSVEQHGTCSDPICPEQIIVVGASLIPGGSAECCCDFCISSSESALQVCMSSFSMEPTRLFYSISKPYGEQSKPSQSHMPALEKDALPRLLDQNCPPHLGHGQSTAKFYHHG